MREGWKSSRKMLLRVTESQNLLIVWTMIAYNGYIYMYMYTSHFVCAVSPNGVWTMFCLPKQMPCPCPYCRPTRSSRPLEEHSGLR